MAAGDHAIRGPTNSEAQANAQHHSLEQGREVLMMAPRWASPRTSRHPGLHQSGPTLLESRPRTLAGGFFPSFCKHVKASPQLARRH